jgi:hypothetical protein
MALTYDPATGAYEPDSLDQFDWQTYYRCVVLWQAMARRDAEDIKGKRGRARREAVEEAQRSADDARQLLCDFLADAFAVGMAGTMRERAEA